MKILLVHPSFPITYWGFQYALTFSGARAMLPPLGLVTVAGLLPEGWDLRLVDLNVRPLEDDAIRWADAVFVGGMIVQRDSMHEVIARARALETRVVVGGPAPTTSPSEFADADLIVEGEIEDRIPELVAAVEAPRGEIRLLKKSRTTPDMTRSPTPRFDLLNFGDYDAMSVQVSRGCPYRCEFCDIIEIYGRVPRIKRPEQVLAELDLLRTLGWRGGVFVVDDNFIGNRPAVRKLLPEVIAYQERHGYPFDFATEASVNLAEDDELIAQMVAAGFTQVFVGIESPSPEALKATQKTQNLRIDLLASVQKLSSAGLEVMAGFIVGFDQDGPEAFEALRDYVQASPIPIAMAGLLMALPETQLSRRLEREGRLRRRASGDQFGRPNFEPILDEETLVTGYAKLLAELYEPAAYYQRCEAHVMRAQPVPGGSKIRFSDVMRLFKVMWLVGVVRPRRRHFWRLLFKTLRKARHNLRRAVVLAVMGEHMIRYTEEHVLPRLAVAVETIRAERATEAIRRVPAWDDRREIPVLVGAAAMTADAAGA
ncbi:MAG: DUF4070 domain-containing protein [Deltaproteobacteria bacterium]|nr:MAG: DUF4070 domain-containing protein [Deltaproteobacteria bacterium]